MSEGKGILTMFNILLIGPANSIFTKDFCMHVLDNGDMNISLLTQNGSAQYRDDYKEKGIKEIIWPEFFRKGLSRQLLHLGRIRKEWNALRETVCGKEELDVVHVHFVEPLHLLYFWGLWKKANRRVLTFWGSDILHASKMRLRFLPLFLRQADRIVFMIPNQYNYFQNIYGNRYQDKIRIVDFGNNMIDEIDRVLDQYSKEECKKHFGFSLNKTVVHIGYNAFKEQQHDLILEEMKKLPEDILHSMQIVFHVSYGKGEGYEAYHNHLIELLEGMQTAYVFNDCYYKEDELAMFRRTCDLFVYGIQSDSRSASPLEYVYADSAFICPEWVAENYELLDRAGAHYYKYQKFDELKDVIMLALQELHGNRNSISDKSREMIRKETSWKEVTPKWKELYE